MKAVKGDNLRRLILFISLSGLSLGQSCMAGTDTYCRSCSAVGCASCVNAFPGVSGTCVPVIIGISNCRTYTAEKTCTLCNEGYYLASTTQCLQLTRNCATGSAEDICASCYKSFVLNSSYACVPGTCPVRGCRLCGLGTCISCESELSLNKDGKCVTPPSVVSNCEVLDASGRICALCANAHYVNSEGGCSFSRDSSMSAGLLSAAVVAATVFLAF